MSAHWGHSYYIVGGIALIALAVCAVPRSVSAQASQQVPVIDESHIEVSKNILETNESIKGLLEKLVEKELKDDPQTQNDAQDALVNKKKKVLEDVQQNYQGYMNNRYLPEEAYNESFVETNPSGHMRDVTNSEFNRYLAENYNYNIENGNFDFSGNKQNAIDQSVALSLLNNTSESAQPRETLSRVTGSKQSAQAFRSGDFSQGGFESWFEISANQSNTPDGAYLKAQDQMSEQIVQARNTEMEKLRWYDGVHGKTDEQGNVVTPGSVNNQRLQDVVRFCDEGLKRFDEHPQTQQRAQQACNQMEQRMRSGGVLIADFLNLFSNFTDNLFDANVDGVFSNLLGDLESQAADAAASVVSNIL
jgi:hypothetical protein